MQTELPLMLRPFLHDLSNSELHAIMTGGFATIAGSVLAAYISIGVSLTLYSTCSRRPVYVQIEENVIGRYSSSYI